MVNLCQVVKSALIVAVATLASLTAPGVEFTLKPGEDTLQLRDRIRAERASGRIAADETVKVTFAPGDHLVTETLVLEAVDSGTEKGPVIWRAEKPGTVRLLGGCVIPREAFKPVAGEAKGRLDPAVADKVLEADVRPLLMREPKPWADAPRDALLPGPWLYVGGKSQQLARWPNADAPDGGWYSYTNVLENCGWEADKRAKKPAVIEFPGDRAERWRFDEGVWFMGYFIVDWNCDLQRIASYDKLTHGARLAGISRYGVGVGGWPFFRRRFYAINLLEELDAPGEWYYERERACLYWHPGTDEGEIVLALDLVPVFRLERACHVRIENLDFAYFHGDAPILLLNDTKKCLVKGCTFENISFHAIDVSGVRNHVTECRMNNCGSMVVRVGGGYGRKVNKDLLPENNLVDNCVFSNFGLHQRSWSPAFEVNGCGNAVRKCKISHAPNSAIIYTGNEHLFADNDIGNVVLEAGDGGAIYSGHNASWLGSLIFGNHIHHLAKTEAEEESRCAIYFDDCDWGDDAIGNTLEHCGQGFLVGGGKLHGLYNNLIANCRAAVSLDGRGRDWRTGRRGSFWWSKDGRTFAEYRHDEAGIDPNRAPWCVAYPLLREAMENRPEYPLMNEIVGNTFVNCRKALTYWGFRKGVVDTDLPGNTILTNATTEGLCAKQPIRLDEAAVNRFGSVDGLTVAEVLLDESGHLAWTLDVGGRPVLDRSPLGITVGAFDFGHRVVPGQAEAKGEVPLASFTNGTVQVVLNAGVAVRNAQTNLVAFAALVAQEWRIPIRNLITGATDAFLDVRVWNGGATYRWTVPGSGARRIAGENGAFIPADGQRASILPVEWERDGDFANGYPEVLYYERGCGWGISFPEFAHGWTHTGPVVTPWRGVLFQK